MYIIAEVNTEWERARGFQDFAFQLFIPCKVCPQLVWELIQAPHLASPFRSEQIHPSFFKKKENHTQIP